MEANDPLNLFPNQCAKTSVDALRYLASYPRPSGGEESFNSAHLLQISRELSKGFAALANPLLASIEWHRVSEGLPEEEGLYLLHNGEALTQVWIMGDADTREYKLSLRGAKYWALPIQAPAELSHEAQEREGAV